jgi:parallel beta-helix repeat protein
VTVSKSVSIEGADKETTILIKETKSVSVKGFTIQGGRRGIQVERATGIVIENNKIQRNARQGILVFERGEALIRNNEILENIPDSSGFAGRGVNVTEAQATLVGNTIVNNSGCHM